MQYLWRTFTLVLKTYINYIHSIYNLSAIFFKTIYFFINKKEERRVITTHFHVGIYTTSKKERCKMSKLEIMRKLICGLFIWNLFLTFGFFIFLSGIENDKMNEKICNLETIPPFEILE